MVVETHEAQLRFDLTAAIPTGGEINNVKMIERGQKRGARQRGTVGKGIGSHHLPFVLMLRCLVQGNPYQ